MVADIIKSFARVVEMENSKILIIKTTKDNFCKTIITALLINKYTCKKVSLNHLLAFGIFLTYGP